MNAKGSILVVDDDALIRAMAKDVLSAEGYNILEAEDAAMGHRVLRANTVDVVLLDIVLPGESGIEMIPEINKAYPDTAVIIMTAFASIDSAIEALRQGAYDYIRKPIDPSDLIHTLSKAREHQALIKDNKGLVKKLSERITKLELFEKTTTAISSTLELPVLLERIMNVTKEVMGAEASSVLLYDDKIGELVFTVATGESGQEVKKFRIKPGTGIAGWVFEKKEPLLLKNVKEDERFYPAVDAKTGFETRSIVAVPLFNKDRVLGVIELINKTDGTGFEDSDLETLASMSAALAVAIDNARMTEDLKLSKEQIEDYSKNLEAMVRKRTEELEEANSELKEAHAHLLQSEKLASIGQLAAGVAHEINNPLSFVKSNMSVLEKHTTHLMKIISGYERLTTALKSRDKSAYKKALAEVDIIKNEAKYDRIMSDLPEIIDESKDGMNRVYKIVSDLRLFSRSDDAERKFMDLHEAIDTTLNIVWNELKYKCAVVKDYGKIPDVECLPTQINQVIMNLLVNAGQAIEKKGTITIKTYNEGEKIFLEISDTGSGMTEETITKIFDPFFTTKAVGKGTGMGLTITYNIVKKHKGDITATSTPGKGTTFKVMLPEKMGLPEGEAVR